jgi:hypothetical protein
MLLLAGCETSTKLGDLLQSKSSDATGALATAGTAGDPASTGTIGTEGLPPVNSTGLLGSDPNDDLNQARNSFAPTILASPSATSGAPWKPIPATPRPG